ncbi:hypothetical protein HZS38_16120 [Xenorhabdus nematophila]|uniref:Uncharacterized protein n=2 Tax=Xenorhabdus nematophila TaxID=628 RepID=D3VEG4_XENNA|nr:DUF6088 family protein [Xenorhabdus nematophila]CEE90904.1 hypothetical protein XNA1_1790001 [Xenorhabdus nematophila str. Anatoliense]AYA41861.1 hypothetical protein D3790_16680 [Xenorhabdus nematophila]MBA0020591.1 hypothetical protein [Xenorhabdus nematophila]MCB4427005.1 hypothetical protein [Xenorhabdus nematophila]QNJ36234.1 hypothetical protein H8F46_16295 [Xenorhabdus nematophila]
MSIAEKVRATIKKMKPGTVFMVSDLPTYHEEKSATLKAVNYYSSSDKLKEKYGEINKIAYGLYYKEEQGILGKLPPSYDAILRAIIIDKNRKVGYVTGHQLFNNKGLSTQVPAITTVVTSKNSPAKIDVAGIKIEVKRKIVRIKERDIKRYEFEFILNNLERVQSIGSENIVDDLSDYIKLIYDDKYQFKELYNHLQYKKTKAFLNKLYGHRLNSSW